MIVSVGSKTTEFKTSEKDFQNFQKHLAFWLKVFGLQHWGVTCFHDSLDHARAQTKYHLNGAVASVILATTWEVKPTEHEMYRSALHEVIHLAVAELAMEAHSRSASEDTLERIEETTVRRFQNVIEDLTLKEALR